MDKRFRWNMFITSFIPLWLSIVVADIWSVIENGIEIWSQKHNVVYNLSKTIQENIVSIIVVLVILILMIISIYSINRFLKDKCNNNESPRIKIKKSLRANKLSSEFLLAYILPMIAFDFTALKSVILFVVYFVMLTTNQHCLNIVVDKDIAEYKYVYYCVCNQYDELLGKKEGARGDLSVSRIMSLNIPVPPLEKQREVVEILEKFEKLCSDISQGIPAEIEARQKQYEYYRDKEICKIILEDIRICVMSGKTEN